jgi:cyanophycinase
MMANAAKTEEVVIGLNGARMRRVCHGPVMPIGGAEGKGDGESDILRRFVEQAGNGKPSRARIALIPTASEDPNDAIARYTECFVKRLGAASVVPLKAERREDANSAKAAQIFEDATGIFISGGDQARLVTLLAGTIAMEMIRRRNAEGVIVAGTSAGASILADHLLVGGSSLTPERSGDSSARRSMVELAAGFGLLHDAVIDQHFSQRGRIGRLLSVFAATPGLIGLGLDEDTAALVQTDGVLEAVGTGMVTIIDGRRTISDYFEREPGEILTIVNASLHVIGPGRKFDLQAREPIPLEQTTFTGPREHVMPESVER